MEWAAGGGVGRAAHQCATASAFGSGAPDLLSFDGYGGFDGFDGFGAAVGAWVGSAGVAWSSAPGSPVLARLSKAIVRLSS